MNQVRYIEENNISEFVPTILIGSDNMTSEADNQQPSFQVDDLKEGSETKVSNSDVRSEYQKAQSRKGNSNSKLKELYASGQLVPWSKGLTAKDDPRIVEMAKKSSEALKLKFASGELKPSRLGRTKDIDTSSQLQAEKCKDQYESGKLIPWNRGLTKTTDERVAKNAEHISIVQKKLFAEGKINLPGKSFLGGFREDLGHFVRSSWEANFARLMNFLDASYEYESKRFLLSDNSTYLPDFYIIDFKHYIEVKGFWWEGDIEKVQLFLSDYPDEILYIVDELEYKKLEEKFARFIPNWERAYDIVRSY